MVKYKLIHKEHGEQPQEEWFTIEDALNGSVLVFGSPLKDFWPSPDIRCEPTILKAFGIKMSEKYFPGQGCQCASHSEADCGCENVDWRTTREVELEAENVLQREELREAIDILDWCRGYVSGYKHDYSESNLPKIDNFIRKVKEAKDE